MSGFIRTLGRGKDLCTLRFSTLLVFLKIPAFLYASKMYLGALNIPLVYVVYRCSIR